MKKSDVPVPPRLDRDDCGCVSESDCEMDNVPRTEYRHQLFARGYLKCKWHAANLSSELRNPIDGLRQADEAVPTEAPRTGNIDEQDHD